MSHFSSHEKLYFVCSASDELFFRESLLCMPLAAYLALDLEDAQYREIYQFSRAGEGQMRLQVHDEASRTAYQIYCGQGLLHKSKPMEPDSREVILPAERARRFLVDRMKSLDKSCAVLLELEDFCTLFALPEGESSLRALISQSEHGNSLLLHMPMRVREGLLDALCAPASPFRLRDGGHALLDSVYEALASGEPQPLFERLQMSLGGAFLQLGTLRYDHLLYMLRHLLFLRGEDPDAHLAMDEAHLLYRWWYLPEVRAQCGGLFSDLTDGGPVSMRALYQRLQSDSGARALEERLRYFQSQAGSQPLLAHLPPVNRQQLEGRCAITLDVPLLLHLSRLPYPEACFAHVEHAFLQLTDVLRWEQMRREVLKPYNARVDAARLGYLQTCLEQAQQALAVADYETACRCYNLLCYVSAHLYDDEARYTQCISPFEKYKYIQLSHTLFTMQRQAPPGPASGLGVVVGPARIQWEQELQRRRESLLEGDRLLWMRASGMTMPDTAQDAHSELDFQGDEALSYLQQIVNTVPQI